MKALEAVIDTESGIDQGIEGPNKAWLAAHTPDDRKDWYRTDKADFGEWCACVWENRRISMEYRTNEKSWHDHRYPEWLESRRAKEQRERRQRMEADPNKPKRITCDHRLNEQILPPPSGLLFYRGNTEMKNHEFSTCPHCFDDIRARERTTGRPQIKVIRYGGMYETMSAARDD